MKEKKLNIRFIKSNNNISIKSMVDVKISRTLIFSPWYLYIAILNLERMVSPSTAPSLLLSFEELFSSAH